MLLFYFVILFYWVCGCMNRASPWNNKINCYFYMIPTLYKECQGNKLWWNFGDSFWFKTNLYRIEDCSRAGKLPLHWLLARYTKTILVIILFTGQLLITLSFIINRPVSGVWKWGGVRFWSCRSHEVKSACMCSRKFYKNGRNIHTFWAIEKLQT